MSNINLLPEEMRGKERKEMIKAAKKPNVFTIDLSAGKKDKPLAPIKPSKPPRSLWSEIFGRKIKPASLPKNLPVIQGVNMLETAKNQNIKYQETPEKKIFKPKNNFLSSLGPVESPVKSSSPEKIIPAKPSFESPKKPDVKVDFKYGAESKKKGRGFFATLFGLFSSKPKAPKPISVYKKHLPEKSISISPSLDLPQKSPNLKVDFKYGVESKKKGRGFFATLFGLFKSKTPKSHKINKKEIKERFIEPSEKIKEKYHTAPRAEKSKLDINLIPQELLFRKYPKGRQQIVGVILAIIIPALIVTSVYTVIDQQQKSIEAKIVKLNNDKSKLISYISGFKDIQQKNIRLQDKLLAVSKLLEKHIYWTKFFSLLERYTLDDIYYTQFIADTSGEFMLPAVAAMGSGSTVEEQIADSYRKAAEQITAFRKASDFVKQIKVSNLEVVSSDKAGVKGVKFEINLALTDGVFIKKNQ